MASCYKNRVTLGDMVVILSPIWVILVRKILLCFGVREVCLWKLLTGHECIGCGMMSAMLYLIRGEFGQAYESNPLVVIVAPVLLYCWLSYVFKVFKRLRDDD